MQAFVARVAFFKSIYREYVDRADRYVSRLTRESNLVGGFHVQIRTTAAARNRCVTTRGRLSRSMRRRPEMQSESECRVDAIIFVGCSRRLLSCRRLDSAPANDYCVLFPSEPLIFPRRRRRRCREYSRRHRDERECNYLAISKGAAARCNPPTTFQQRSIFVFPSVFDIKSAVTY